MTRKEAFEKKLIEGEYFVGHLNGKKLFLCFAGENFNNEEMILEATDVEIEPIVKEYILSGIPHNPLARAREIEHARVSDKNRGGRRASVEITLYGLVYSTGAGVSGNHEGFKVSCRFSVGEKFYPSTFPPEGKEVKKFLAFLD